MELKEGRTERLKVDKVIPYWRNPRVLNQEAVDAVKRSIQEYGYSQPIVVDQDYVIIAGHTRYSAMRSMGADEVDVLVVDYLGAQQVKQLRIVDNRAGEYAFWDFDKLQDEILGMDDALLKELFPETDELGEDGQGEGPTISWDTEDESWKDVDTNVEFVCPRCFHEWEQEVTRKQIMSGEIKSEAGA